MIDEVKLEEETKKWEFSVVGKLHAKITISKEVLRTTMTKVWKTLKLVSVQELYARISLFSVLETSVIPSEDNEGKAMVI